MKSHFFIILPGPYRGLLCPPEEVQADPSLDTFSLSLQGMLRGLHIVRRGGEQIRYATPTAARYRPHKGKDRRGTQQAPLETRVE